MRRLYMSFLLSLNKPPTREIQKNPLQRAFAIQRHRPLNLLSRAATALIVVVVVIAVKAARSPRTGGGWACVHAATACSRFMYVW
jgi:hypothetical protein